MLGTGRSGATGEGLRGRRKGEALSHVPEDSFPLGWGHGGLWGGVAGVVGVAGEEILGGVHAVVQPLPACSPCQAHPPKQLLQVGGGPPGENSGGVGLVRGGAGLRGLGPGAAVTGPGGWWHVLVAWGAG